MSDTIPLVSVCMITYNQAVYIEQAILGVLMQEVDFEIELIISNDLSTDFTDSIIQNILQSHPRANQITYYNQKCNLGMMKNFVFALNHCRGKYVAMCEGDDYWTDPYKLQKQIDFLKKNSDFILCYHPVKRLRGEKFVHDSNISDRLSKSISNIYDVIVSGNYINTCSIVFRNIKFNFHEDYYLSPFGDFLIFWYLAKYGNFFKLDEEMAVYRLEVGIYSRLDYSIMIKKNIDFFKIILRHEGDQTLQQLIKWRLKDLKYKLDKSISSPLLGIKNRIFNVFN